ncbi:MAG TPA: luciferase family protein [Solirubrobacterales bacterium]|nr:luciferase family protein [Solirubrobacterales bacterium]
MSTTTQRASERITVEVTSWDGVEAGPGRRGEFAFRLGHRELGHLHGDHAAHFSFPRRRWEELAAEGRVVEHPVFPGKHGPAARRIEDDADVADVIALMRLNYDAALERREG